MKKAAVIVCIFILACGAGIASFTLYAKYRGSLARNQNTADAPPATRLKYTPAKLECKTPCVQVYELPDGGIVAEGLACYESPAEAERGLGESLGPTTSVAPMPGPSDTLSKEKGRLAVAFPPDDRGDRRYEVVHHGGGKCYYYINAPSLAIASDFEKSDSPAYQLYRRRLSN